MIVSKEYSKVQTQVDVAVTVIVPSLVQQDEGSTPVIHVIDALLSTLDTTHELESLQPPVLSYQVTKYVHVIVVVNVFNVVPSAQT